MKEGGFSTFVAHDIWVSVMAHCQEELGRYIQCWYPNVVECMSP